MEPAVACSKVLVGIDFGDCCERALLHAVTLAEQAQGQLELVHVYEWDLACASARPGTDTQHADGATAAEIQFFARAAKRRLGELCSALVGDRVSAEIKICFGDPAVELCRAAEQSGATLLVLGVQGRGALHRSAGHTAHRVCALSRVPVLLVSESTLAGADQLLLRGSGSLAGWLDPAPEYRHGGSGAMQLRPREAARHALGF